VRALSYFVEEASRSLWRRRAASILAAGTSAVSLLVLGLFLLAGSNASRILERWSATAELSVYLNESATPENRRTVERALAASGVVTGHSYVTQAEALRRFSVQFPDLAASARSLPSNPLPASYDVRIRPERAQHAQVEALAERARALPGVSDVRYDRRWLDRLAHVVAVARTAGLVLAGLIILASCVTVMSVVRLTLFARRQEIEIMQLVGAPLSYIRGPFIMEGTILGIIGALVATALLWVSFAAWRGPLVAQTTGIVDAGTLAFLPVTTVVGLVLGGGAIGCLGGVLAARGAR
jgi:cell division transport system permease protein